MARAKKPARKRPKKRAAPAPSEEYEVRIAGVKWDGASASQLSFKVFDRALYSHTARWSYILGNRRRMSEGAWTSLAKKGIEDLEAIGVPDAGMRIKDLARADVIEVTIPFAVEEVGWAARIFPWEGVIALITRPHRPDRMIHVVRHLDRRRRADSRPSPPRKLLLVPSGPGVIGDRFSFDTECRMVQSVLGFAAGDNDTIKDPDLGQLRERIRKTSPSVIHLTGMDIHQAEQLIEGINESLEEGKESLKDGKKSLEDGFVLRGDSSAYAPVLTNDLTEALTKGKPPILVAFNCHHSASRMAAMTVAKGARMAIGFQDRVNDDAAEQFFASFYETWRGNGWNALQAFASARSETGESFRQGSGIVLWSDHSLLPAVKTSGPLGAVPRPKARKARTDKLPELVKAFVDPHPELNYSMLHNGRDIFRSFVIKKTRNVEVPLAAVEVVLHAGEFDFPFRTQVPLEMVTPMLDKHRVSVPLVAQALRQCRESLRSALFVEVKCGEALIYRHTHTVTLLSADEWRDDALNRCWLPSFVLPRDPAVKRIVDAAQRYLCAISDDPQAGFDGYQRVSATGEDPDGAVDAQVQALWNALLHDLPLSYINPPPTYTQASQRLRTPSQVIEGKRGTCIDLALLFAACLEYVGIFPVVFLIEGHAFPGYWRSDHAWSTLFNEFRDAPPAQGFQVLPPPDGKRSTPVSGQSAAWMLDGTEVLKAMWREVQAGNIAPFESTLVTQRGSFQRALADGTSNLAADSFEALVDINRARDPRDGVLPLPILPEHQ